MSVGIFKYTINFKSPKDQKGLYNNQNHNYEWRPFNPVPLAKKMVKGSLLKSFTGVLHPQWKQSPLTMSSWFEHWNDSWSCSSHPETTSMRIKIGVFMAKQKKIKLESFMAPISVRISINYICNNNNLKNPVASKGSVPSDCHLIRHHHSGLGTGTGQRH